jgi:hypothetical protein
MRNLIKKIQTFKGPVLIFDIDTKDDIADLPNSTTDPSCVQGSIANCIEEGKSYVLDSKDNWTPVNRFIDYWEM